VWKWNNGSLCGRGREEEELEEVRDFTKLGFNAPFIFPQFILCR